MRLEVGHVGPALPGDRGEEVDLVPDPARQHLGRRVHVFPSEVLTIEVGHLGADHHATLRRVGAHRTHGGLVPGVETAGEVRAGDHPEEPRIVGHALAEVRVEVNLVIFLHGSSLPGHRAITEKCLRSQVRVQLRGGSSRQYW